MGVALALGVIVGVRGALTERVTLVALIVLGLLALTALSQRTFRPLLVCGALGCALGLAGGHWRAPSSAPPYDGSLRGGTVGVVTSDPETSGAGQRADVRWTDPAGVQRVWSALLPAAPAVGRGDTIRFGGWISDPVRRRLTVTSLRVVAGPGRIEFARRRLRTGISDAILREVPGSPGTLTVGLLLGDDSGLTRAERDQLRQAGMSHITAISGWNVSIVVAGVGALGVALRLRGRGWAAAQLLALLAFVWLVGLQPTVLRAALMTVSAFAAAQFGRPRHTLNALGLTAALLACLSPAVPGTLSFQLSALATAGVAIALQWTPRWTGWLGFIAGPAAIGAAAALATAPLLAGAFGTFTLASIPASVLAGPPVMIATFAGAAVAPLTALGCAKPAAVPAWLASALLLRSAAWFATAPLGHWTFAPLSGGAVAGIYAALSIAGAQLLPEGRLARRRLARWAAAQPLPATAAGATVLAIVALALVTL